MGAMSKVKMVMELWVFQIKNDYLGKVIVMFIISTLEIPASRVFLGANAQLLGTSRLGT